MCSPVDLRRIFCWYRLLYPSGCCRISPTSWHFDHTPSCRDNWQPIDALESKLNKPPMPTKSQKPIFQRSLSLYHSKQSVSPETATCGAINLIPRGRSSPGRIGRERQRRIHCSNSLYKFRPLSAIADLVWPSKGDEAARLSQLKQFGGRAPRIKVWIQNTLAALLRKAEPSTMSKKPKPADPPSSAAPNNQAMQSLRSLVESTSTSRSFRI